MSLNDLMGWSGPMTHRQHMAWLAWFKIKDDEPSLTDHYLMQVALEVHGLNFILSNQRPSFSLQQFKLKKPEPPKKMTKDELDAHVERQMAGWKAWAEGPKKSKEAREKAIEKAKAVRIARKGETPPAIVKRGGGKGNLRIGKKKR